MLRLKTFSAFLALVASWATIAALPVASGGCGTTACFVWTAAEGSCPSSVEALKFFGNPDCGSSVTAVNGEGSFDGQLCCYPVTKNDSEFFGEEGCFNGVGGGFGGSINEGGFGTVGGSGGDFGGGSCFTCGEVLTDPSIDPGFLCSFSAEVFDVLVQCICADACSMDCVDNVCQGFSATEECQSCMQDTSPNGCGNEVNECLNDF